MLNHIMFLVSDFKPEEHVSPNLNKIQQNEDMVPMRVIT